MAETNITRSGNFDPSKLPTLEGKLRQAGLPTPLGVYATPDADGVIIGLRANWPNGLTVPQTVQATAIVNAYVEPTDLSQLSPLQLQAYNFLQLNNPTAAQQLAALRGIIKWALQYSTGKIDIDGTSIQ